ncbi:hypothetical protein F2Q65_03755 [Thiohalocapsa marina]|uniref:SPOR domain-containing protein n=1 Tax=Thiohalocapsa marina TaxID=424902 RepID=A0A5M8FT83_9GAMM|nr:SPOR domain-containing protein [Thiohalocapsa marina]KAA6187014.1 hypothetical protein F2Q65_03755 [Thiohalocapsa marina]
MDEGAKRRLVGATVLVALAVVFVPMLVDDKGSDDLGEPIIIPDAPDFDAAYEGSGQDASFQPPPADVTVPDSRQPELTPALPVPEPPSGAEDLTPFAPEPVVESFPEPVPEPSGEPVARPRPSDAEPTPVRKPPPPPRPQPAEPVKQPSVPAGTQSWIVQVASLGSAEAAKSLQDSLRDKGFPAFVEQAVVGGKRYYRVRVGPDIDRARAERTARQLQAETGNKPLVQQYR